MDSNKFQFSADIQPLRSLLINNCYSNKEIFLRELISNASDALEKVKLLSETKPDLAGMNIEPDLKIKVIPDKTNNTLIIQDTGIGMTKEEIINNLGTLGKSSTKSFQETSSKCDVNMIGQFGVGFYSSFLVADKVTVISKSIGGNQYKWESTAQNTFSVKEDKNNPFQITRGTAIFVALNQDNLQFLEEEKIKEVLKKYSQFVGFPIELQIESKERKTINLTKPLWMKMSKDVTQEEYTVFYQQFTNDKEGYLHVKQFQIEGSLEYKALLFIPNKAPIQTLHTNQKRNNIKLYVRKVFIMDDCNELIPEYLGFVQGILEFDDLPLNISRESLQQSKIFKVIKRYITRKCIEMIAEIAENAENYNIFYKQYSKYLKLGILEDSANITKFSKFLKYQTSKSGEDFIFLNDYVNRMKQGQDEIFFITGESKSKIIQSLFVQALEKYHYEVVFMTDPIDEYVIKQLKQFDGKNLKSCTNELYINYTNEDQKKQIEERAEFEQLCQIIKRFLGDQVKSVRIGKQIDSSPCAIVTEEYGWSANMERIMKAQILRDSSIDNQMLSKKVLEINPNHSIIIELQKRSKVKDMSIRDLIWILYETSLLTSGYSLNEPILLVNLTYKLIELSLLINNNIIEKTVEKQSETIKSRLEEID